MVGLDEAKALNPDTFMYTAYDCRAHCFMEVLICICDSPQSLTWYLCFLARQNTNFCGTSRCAKSHKTAYCIEIKSKLYHSYLAKPMVHTHTYTSLWFINDIETCGQSCVNKVVHFYKISTNSAVYHLISIIICKIL